MPGEYYSQDYIRRKKRRRTIIGIAMAGITLTAGFLTFRHNNHEADKLKAVATHTAHTRNTCSIRSVEEKVTAQGPALKIIVNLAVKEAVEPYAVRYDNLGMDVTMDDNEASTISGILVVNTDRQKNGEPSSAAIASTPGDSPDESSNAAEFTASLFSEQGAVYEVYRQNAINVQINGPLVRDTRYTKTGKVLCGSFTYKP